VNQLGLQSKHSARAIDAYQRHRNKKLKPQQWLTMVTAGLPQTKPAC
jgi:hypothetical protein